jgi:hypothetical protein
MLMIKKKNNVKNSPDQFQFQELPEESAPKVAVNVPVQKRETYGDGSLYATVHQDEAGKVIINDAVYSCVKK